MSVTTVALEVTWVSSVGRLKPSLPMSPCTSQTRKRISRCRSRRGIHGFWMRAVISVKARPNISLGRITTPERATSTQRGEVTHRSLAMSQALLPTPTTQMRLPT